MKPSARRVLRQLRDHIEDKTESARTAKRVIEVANTVKRDRRLSKWYDDHVKGRDPELVPEIITGGVERGEITEIQAQNLGSLVAFVTERGYPTATEVNAP
jgi:hypothetical protein